MATIRIRCAAGTFRLKDLPSSASVAQMKQLVHSQHGIPASNAELRLDPKAAKPLEDSATLGQLGLAHGSMLYLDSPEAMNLAPAVRKTVDAEGNLLAAQKSDGGAGFRPGLSSLRSQKLHWTLTEMTELDDQYTFIIKGKERLFCANVSLDLTSAQNFQAYLRQFAFKRPRWGHLYGRFEPVDAAAAGGADAPSAAAGAKRYGDTKGRMRVSDFNPEDDSKPRFAVRVDCIYEPKQEVDANGNTVLLEDPRLERADRIAQAFGLRRVGVIFSHPPGREGYHFSAHEVITAGLAALDATDGLRDSPFVCVSVSPDEKGLAEMHPFQLTKTCLDMVAEDALLVMPVRPGFAAVRETFSAVVEAKSAEVLDTDLLIKRVPILSHQSPISSGFPKLNRDVGGPDAPALRKLLADNNKSPRLAKALADFDVLMFLGEGLDNETLGQIAASVKPHAYGPPEQAVNLPEGFLLMIREVAGVR